MGAKTLSMGSSTGVPDGEVLDKAWRPQLVTQRGLWGSPSSEVSKTALEWISHGIAVERASFATLFSTEDARTGVQSCSEGQGGRFVGR